jgi:hypothetical protein
MKKQDAQKRFCLYIRFAMQKSKQIKRTKKQFLTREGV